MSPRAEHVHAPASPSRGSRILAAIGAAVALALAIVLLIVAGRGRASEADAEPTSDVPRRVGEAIEVTPAFRDGAGIATAPVIRGPLKPVVSVVGEATFDPTHVAAVGTRAKGIVTKVLHVEGDHVEEGDLLATIESPDLTEAQADVRIAAAKKKAAALDAERERELLERQLTTAREHEQAQAALAQQRALERAAQERVEALGGAASMGVSELRAPVAGVVAERSIAPGQNVGDSLVAFRVGDLDQLWVLLRVFERHVEVLRAGDHVDIRSLSAPDRTIHGKVAHIGSVLDPATRTTDVRVEVDNEERWLRPGQAVEAKVHASGPAGEVLSVPSAAVTYVDGAPTVFVAETPTRFSPRRVELGFDGGDRLAIKGGLREGEQVVSKSVLALKSELFR